MSENVEVSKSDDSKTGDQPDTNRGHYARKPGFACIRLLSVALCWWFGCDPDYPLAVYGEGVPCKRCECCDVPYGDLVGDTRHRRFVESLKYWVTEPVNGQKGKL